LALKSQKKKKELQEVHQIGNDSNTLEDELTKRHQTAKLISEKLLDPPSA